MYLLRSVYLLKIIIKLLLRVENKKIRSIYNNMIIILLCSYITCTNYYQLKQVLSKKNFWRQSAEMQNMLHYCSVNKVHTCIYFLNIFFMLLYLSTRRLIMSPPTGMTLFCYFTNYANSVQIKCIYHSKIHRDGMPILNCNMCTIQVVQTNI